jgi:hypothetical protein
MLDTFNFPTPQTANYQEFYGPGAGNTTKDDRTWIKPRGVSMVRFMLIGAGGDGGNGSASNGGGGGASASVTSWIGPAIFVPDILSMRLGVRGGGSSAGTTRITYYSSNGINILLSATGGGNGGTTTAGGVAGAAMIENQFTASGIFSSTIGQAGTLGSASGPGVNQAASTVTFLSGGAGGAGFGGSIGGSVTPTFGYLALPNTPSGGTVAGANGYFITQPLLVGCGGAGGTTSTTIGSAGGRGGIGCGGGGSGEDAASGGRGGESAVFVWSW